MDMMLYTLILFSVVAQLHAQDPVVTIVETSPMTNEKNVIDARRDEDVILDCYVENLQRFSDVYWQRVYTTSKGKEQTLQISKNEGANDNTKHGIEKPTQFTWRLRIKSIKVSDSGRYECYVYMQLQIFAMDVREVVVNIRPTLDAALTSTDMTVREGDDVELLCTATGLPEPMIEWTRQGGAMLPVGMELYRGDKMFIENIRHEHRGVYFCHAFNKIGDERRAIRLNVRFKPQVVILDRVVDQAVGYQVELQCFVDSNPYPDESNVRWNKGRKTYTTTSGKYQVKAVRGAFNRMTFELIITDVQEEDFGLYTCTVTNSEGTSTKTIELKKSDTPIKSRKLGRVIKASSASTVSFTYMLLAASSLTAVWLL